MTFSICAHADVTHVEVIGDPEACLNDFFLPGGNKGD